MTRALFALILAAITLSSFADSQVTETRKKELVILTWEDYIEPEVVSAFEKKHNATVRFVYFEEDDERDELMANSLGQGFDIVCIDDVLLEIYEKQGWITNIDATKIPNLKYIDYPWNDAYQTSKEYSVPYFWGTVGIAYLKSKMDKPTSWMDIFQPKESLSGKILVQDTAQVIFGLALKAYNYSINSSDENEIKKAEDLLWAQKPHVAEYSPLILDENSQLNTGKIYAAMAYNGDALMLMEENKDIDFVIPNEGTSIWVDFFSVTRSSKHPELAHAFLNFINEPKIAAKNAEYVSYASPNIEARKILGKEYLNNPHIFPSDDVIKRSELFARPNNKVMRRMIDNHVILTGSK